MFNILISYPNFLNLIVDFCNLSFQSGIVPDELKVIRIVPIPKLKSPQEFNHLRPIGISHFLMALLEKIYISKMTNFVRQKCLLSKYQFGCRRGHCTEHAMISLIDNVKKQLDCGHLGAIVSLDLRNAFPSVHREKLLCKLVQKFKVSDFWLRNYFSNRKQFVQVEGGTSDTIPSLTGVIQGSVLGPVLFTYYINDLSEALKFSTPEIYVDDTNLLFYGSLDDLDSFMLKINNEMRNVCAWVDSNSLILNDNKTKLLLISSKIKLSKINNFKIEVNNCIIEACSELKCLGLIIDSTLSWEGQINKCLSACYLRIYSLFKLKDCIPKTQLIIVAQAVVLSLMNYMYCIWGDMNKKSSQSIEKMIRTLARLVLGKKKYDRILNLMTSELQWLLPQFLYIFKIACLVFKLHNCKSVEYFNDYFIFNNAVHSYPTTSSNKFNVNFHINGNFGFSTFHFKAIMIWNGLPNNIKEIKSYVTFKNTLKQYLLTKQINDL